MFGKKNKEEPVNRIRTQDFLKDQETSVSDEVEDQEEVEQEEEIIEPVVKKKVAVKEVSPPTKEEIKDMILGNISRAVELMRYL